MRLTGIICTTLLISSCSGNDDGDDRGSGDAATGGSATGGSSSGSGGGGSGGIAPGGGGSGGVGTGGIGSGGIGAGGTTGAGTGGVAPADGGLAGQHCSPGTFLQHPGDTYGIGNMSNCYRYPMLDGGIDISADPSIRSIKLATPMTPGEPYAISIEITDGPVNAEFWGADTVCGAAQEFLWSGTIEEGIFCVAFEPTAAHNDILMVWRVTVATHESVTLCPTGTCGP